MLRMVRIGFDHGGSPSDMVYYIIRGATKAIGDRIIREGSWIGAIFIRVAMYVLPDVASK